MRRKFGSVAAAKPRHVKDLLSKAGLNANQITQATEHYDDWLARVHELVGPDWATHVTQARWIRGELTVQVDSSARATRVRLLLGAALLDGQLALSDRGEVARTVKVRS